ncbi:serine hydrolase [Lysobacter sp. SG-8]|uniref:Beta-lactamase n=1 Tax=Marilutibacter penaei TaxID=2759900 RepID=A0A7W3YF42_9GAMM|nr:serine hydrolase [Lysobacter penaei]MBB1089489.1 serine hydrolase [Lysobacter penaei]
MKIRKPRFVSILALVLGTSAATGACAGVQPEADIDPGLQATVERRIGGDRSGACLAVGVVKVEGNAPRIRRAYACADPKEAGRIGANSAFEIGSVSKTMTATLLAGLIESGQASLDDPLADYLPEGTGVPRYGEQVIRLRHVVSHTSGLPALPPGVPLADPRDPYAAMTPDALLGALDRVQLTQAPGETFAYSNFASMLLSLAVARRAGEDFDVLLRERLFQPLGMGGAHLDAPPEGIVAAEGHLPNGSRTPAWHFDPALAGVGGVRATLDDMLRYAEGELGRAPQPLADAIELTQQPLQTPAGTPIAMNWMLADVGGHAILAHEGGTGGFSSLVAIDRERGRGVVVLSDTALTSLGGLGDLGMHLLDERQPLPGPRKAVPAPDALIDALVGEWQLQGGPAMSVRRKGDALEIQAPGQPAFEMGHDDRGDFYPLAFDALMHPLQGPDGGYTFVWHQGGGAMPARRLDAVAAGAAAGLLSDYAGTYPLAPTDMTLTVSERDGVLHAQATGQGAFALVPAGGDVFRADAFGIEIRFQRDGSGRVVALALHQGGQVLGGERL